MPEKTKLEELSGELPEEERKELLAKINREMQRGEREEIVRVELKAEERERLIAVEMLKISWWMRFIIWLRSTLSGRTRRQLFIDQKLGQLKKSVKQRNPGLSGFETRDLTPIFARLLFDLYAATFQLKSLFQAFVGDQEFREEAVTFLFEARYEEAKKNVEELVSLEQMEDIYAESGSEEEVKKQILRKLKEYLHKIPEKQFENLDEGIKPFIYLKSLVLFLFSSLFRHFNYFFGDRLDEKYPYFDHAPAMLMLDQLERLYYAVYLAMKLTGDWFCHEEILHYYCLYRRDAENAEEPDRQEIEQEIIELAESISVLMETVEQFNQKMPLLELIKYFRKDPYYRLSFNIPRFHIKSVYAAAMKASFLEQLAEKIIDVKRNAVDRKIRDIFKNDQLLELFYYNDKPNFDFRKLGLPFFIYTKSLMVLYNYLSKIYRGYIQEVVQIAGAYVLSNNRLVQSRLMQCAAALEELEAKIVLFDRSLSPDEDDGKAMMRYRHRISTDLTQQRYYKNFITQKDREANELLDKGIENLLAVKKIFDEISTSPMENVKSVLKTLHFYRGKNQILSDLLKATSDIIAEFHSLLDQLLSIEKGS